MPGNEAKEMTGNEVRDVIPENEATVHICYSILCTCTCSGLPQHWPAL